MTLNGWLQIALYAVLISPAHQAVRRLHGPRVRWRAHLLRRCCARSSAASIASCGVDEDEEQNWLIYAVAMLAFSVAGFVVLYALLRLQGVLPFNPQGSRPMSPRPGVQHRHQLRHQHQLAVLYAAKPP